MSRSESIAKLLPALIKARAAMPPVLKQSDNPHFRSRYADLAGVLEACEPALGAHGLAVLQTPQWAEGVLTLETLLVHDSGEWLLALYPILTDYSKPQMIGAGVTYARRYSYMSVVGVAPEDDDGETASGRGNNHSAARPVAPPPRPPQPQRPPAANANGNGHATRTAAAVAAITAQAGQRARADVAPGTKPTRGSQLWKWAVEIEKTQGQGIMAHLEEYGSHRGWGSRLTAWTDAAVREGYEDAQAALEVIYDVHGDAGDADGQGDEDGVPY